MLDKRTKQIWRGLVDYVNASDLESNTKGLKNLAGTLFESMPWMARNPYGLIDYANAASLESDRIALRNLAEGISESISISATMHLEMTRNPLDFTDVPEMIAVQINPDALRGAVKGGKEPARLSFRSEQKLTNQFRQQAVEYQPQVRRLLTWLSNPKRNAEGRPLAFEFLSEHMKHIEFERGDPAFAPEEEQSRYFTPGGDLKDDFPHRTLFYKDIADPICDFIQKEHEPEREPPIQICKRPECGNLVMRFKKREYCRTVVCDRERQKRDDDVKQKKNRDRVFIHRLNRLPLAVRRARVWGKADYLREMVSYWQDSDHGNPTLVRQASKLLELAGNTSETTPRSTPADDLPKG